MSSRPKAPKKVVQFSHITPREQRFMIVDRETGGSYPVTADIPKKRHTVPKECSCPDAENIAQSSNAKPSP
ncbi:hypothetical protein MARINON1_60242 [Marinobacter salarius]|nr:hypothetical protein MBHK15_100252 [Marinobacter salarius]VXC44442.1 hypothetical protein MARINON1_60242 [Marinobacter salarius]